MTDDVVMPLYLSLALVFLGVSVASKPSWNDSLPESDRNSGLGLWGGVLASLSCVSFALVPVLGKVMLPVATLFFVCSLAALAMRVQSWLHPLRAVQIWRWSAWVLVLGALNFLLIILKISLGWRVTYQALLVTFFLLWVFLGLWQLAPQERTRQATLVLLSVGALWALVVFWSWVVYANTAWGGVMVLGRNVSEPWFGFVARLFVVGALLMAYVSANGYALDRMVRSKLQTSNEKARAEHLNEELQELLYQKQEMLQAMSFAARSQNLPAIMSSLTHEINQPLGAMRLNADYLLEDAAHMSEKDRQDVLQQMVLCSQSAHQVMQDFRRFFDAAQVQPTLFALDVLVTDVLRAMSSDFGRAGVGVDRGALAPVWVRGDPVQLESAVTGVAHFLLGRLPAGQVQRFFVELVVDSGFAHLRLLTDGPTLSRQAYEHAMVRDMADGTGSFSRGLWLARAIVEHHSGAMNVFADELWSGVSLQLPVQESDL